MPRALEDRKLSQLPSPKKAADSGLDVYSGRSDFAHAATCLRFLAIGIMPEPSPFRSLRLAAQDVALSRRKHGFDSRTDYLERKFLFKTAFQIRMRLFFTPLTSELLSNKSLNHACHSV